MIGFLASVGVLEADGSRGVEITRAKGGRIIRAEVNSLFRNGGEV